MSVQERTTSSVVLPIVGIVAVGVVLGAPSILLPFGRDQGIYAYTAERLLQGATLYRDVFVFKPPMTVYVHTAALEIFGRSMAAIRLLDVGWTIFVAIALFLLARRLLGSVLLATGAAIVYLLSYFALGYWYLAQTEGWANLPIVVSFVLVARALERPERQAEWLAAGAAAGVAFLFKYPLGFPLFVAILAAGALGASWLWLRVASFLVAGFAVGVAGGLAHLWATGGLDELVVSQWRVIFPYVGGRRPDAGGGLVAFVGGLARLPLTLRSLAVLGVVGLVVGLRRDTGRWGAAQIVLVLGWLACASLVVVVQGKFFVYHYLPLLPLLAFLAAAAFLPLRNRWHAMSICLVIVTTLVLVVETGTVERIRSTSRISGEPSGTLHFWMSSRFQASDYSFADDFALAAHVRHTTPEGSRMFIWGHEPTVYFLANRTAVSRFPYVFPLVFPWAPPSLRPELLHSLREDPPLLFIVSSRDATPWVTGNTKDSWATFEEFAALRRFVEERYRFERRLSRFRIYRLETDGGGIS